VPRRKKAERLAPTHLVDTNVLLRFLIGDDPPKAERAFALMKRVEGGGETVKITDEVITETVWTLDSFYRVPRSEIVASLIGLLGFSGIRVSSRDVLLEALQKYGSTSADFVDCFLAARANHDEISVYSFDETDFKKLGVAWERP
jgi:predicted nucleic-acid-binding protein